MAFPYRRIVGQKIRAYRKQVGLSQEKLAADSGLDRTYISGIERMARNFTIDSLEKILHGLGISVEEFFKKIK